MKAYGLTLCLQDDPEKIARYKEYHRAVWPAVLARLRAVGVHEMKIFLRGQRMFMYIETNDVFEPLRDFARQRRPAIGGMERPDGNLAGTRPGSDTGRMVGADGTRLRHGEAMSDEQ